MIGARSERLMEHYYETDMWLPTDDVVLGLWHQLAIKTTSCLFSEQFDL
jgi:hypothetical protein